MFTGSNYTFNPGVVLDPVTMAPMLTNSSHISLTNLANAPRTDLKIWQKMFLSNIPQECPDEIVVKLLTEFGQVKSFKRASDNYGNPKSFGHFDMESGEDIFRVKRLFYEVKVLDNILDVKLSGETENFLREWLSMQQQQWRKKLQSNTNAEASNYDSIEQFHTRNDKKDRQRIEESLRLINIEVRKIAAERMKEEERKEHPRETERRRKKKKLLEEQDRGFRQKEEHWLRREKDKERERKKDKEKEKERLKMRQKKLEKQMSLDSDEQNKRRADAIKKRMAVEAEQQEDIAFLLQANPPLPEEDPDAYERKKFHFTLENSETIQNQPGVGQMLAELPQMVQQVQEQGQATLKPNSLFQGWQQQDPNYQNGAELDLNLPQIITQVDKKDEEQRKLKLAEIKSKVPSNKQDLWTFPIDWERLAKSMALTKNIRPWLEMRSAEYIGEVVERFVALVQKKIFGKSHPDKIIKILEGYLENDTEEFVYRLWRELAFECLKLDHGIQV